MDKDRVEGAARETGGRMKEGVGRVLGDTRLQAEGRSQTFWGRVQHAWGDMKDVFRGHH
ncbi:CsbD family protein [Caulobacter sp. 17J80-11]|uniref:CsbD family protein n=1 Tax=Caulobacter sp. 17J80-11 TaxID=2763502 RepID=UPI001653A120|nr:CsbD family protein [Caulobacter sp. 17J80-11]MBC6981107.1 CsbD family protein [Caulobacter sp. 17J80-11]